MGCPSPLTQNYLGWVLTRKLCPIFTWYVHSQVFCGCLGRNGVRRLNGIWKGIELWSGQTKLWWDTYALWTTRFLPLLMHWREKFLEKENELWTPSIKKHRQAWHTKSSHFPQKWKKYANRSLSICLFEQLNRSAILFRAPLWLPLEKNDILQVSTQSISLFFLE